MLWVDKYRPRTLDEVIGNTEVIDQVRAWASAWAAGNPQKPLLLVGPPGVGKTATAYAVASQHGWEVIEMNASDFRTRSAVERVLGHASEANTFSGRMRLILIDEVDGLQAQDYGGAGAVVEVLKKARHPVILTANDDYSSPVRLVKGLCKVLQFKRVNYREIASFLAKILQKEGIEYDYDALLELARRQNGDVRSALLDLQAIAEQERRVTKDVVEALGYRDREARIFDVLRKIFKAEHVVSPFALTATLDVDPDMFKAWIVENIPREYSDREEIAEAYHWVSRSDVFAGRIIRRQYWGFLSYAQELLVNGVIVAKKRKHTRFVGYQFPSFIRKMAAAREMRARRKKVASKISPVLHASPRVLVSDVFPFLQLIFRRKEWAAYLVAKAGLTEEDVAFVLSTDVSDAAVKEIMKEAEKARKQFVRKEEHRQNEEQRGEEEGTKQATLFDYMRPSR